MNIDREVQNIIDSFNKVFKQLGQTPLLDNSNFRVDQEISYHRFIRFISVEKEGRIKLRFEVSESGLTFSIDRTSEIPEWSFDYIKSNRERIENELKLLFESIIEVEYKGHKTTIRLFDKEGAKTRQYKDSSILEINWFSRKTVAIYRPYFENE